MNPRDKLLLTLAAVVGVLAASWFVLIQPKRQDAQKLEAQISAAQSELAGTAGRAAQYRAARETLRKHPEAFARAGRALPNRIAMPDVLRTLTRTARGTGVTIGDLTAGGGTDAAAATGGDSATAATPGIGSVGLQLSFTGGFLSLQRYLNKLQHLVDVSRHDVEAKGRLMALNSVQLSPGDGGDLSAKVSATVYVLQPGGLASSAATGTTGAAGAPAPTSTTTTAAAPAAPAAPAPASTPTAGGVQ